MRSPVAFLTALTIIAVSFTPACAKRPIAHGVVTSTTASAHLSNGLYAVVAEAATADGAAPESRGARTLAYDAKKADPTSDVSSRYVTIDAASFVPLVLAREPDASPGEDGRMILSVALAPQYVRTLEDFTRAHLHGKAAVVLDGEILTVHKLREVVEGGRMQITRCTDRACASIRTKLIEGGRTETGK